MKVLIDGVEVKVENDVRIVYGHLDKNSKPCDLQLVANHEGIIYDLFDVTGEVVASSYDFVGDLVERIDDR